MKKSLSAKTVKSIKNNMMACGAKFAIGYVNDAGQLLTVNYAPTAEGAMQAFIKNIPTLVNMSKSWDTFTIAI